MGFAGVYRAIYAYTPTNDEELEIKENDLLYLIETADDGWWTVKKRVAGAASEEPQGIVPHNYIEPAKPEGQAHALYAYERQTDEELSFAEGSVFDLYASDGEWVLVGFHDGSSYGFVPHNYIERGRSSQQTAESANSTSPQNASDGHSSAAPASLAASTGVPAEPSAAPIPLPKRPPKTEQNLDEEINLPPRPARPTRDMLDRELPSEPRRVPSFRSFDSRSSAKFNEPKPLVWKVQDIIGKKRIPKKLILTSSYVELSSGEKYEPDQRWDVKDIVSYSNEKKHVFIDLKNPAAMLEMKAESKSESDQIIATIGQIAGAGRSGGIDEVVDAYKSRGVRNGQIVIDFRAANSRELSVTENEVVFIIDSSDNDWWRVRNFNGKEGLVPRKYVHIDKGKGHLTLEEKRKRLLAHEGEKRSEQGTGSSLNRTKSSSRSNSVNRERSTRRRSEQRQLPEPSKMRVWVDRTGNFKVDAQLLGCSDGKVHLHKFNGVKIAVPISKLSTADVEYVESVTGVKLSEDASLSEDKSSQAQTEQVKTATNQSQDSWLSFFLRCGIDPHNANRYARNFARDNMDVELIGDISAPLLRNLGLREGDILRFTKHVNEKLGRNQKPDGGLYSSEDGTLRNNSDNKPANIEDTVWNTGKSESQTAASTSYNTASNQSATTHSQSQPQPTGALADLLGLTSISDKITNNSVGLLPQNTASIPAPNVAQFQPQNPLQPQKTVESEIAAQQRVTQHQILRQQAELQQEQIKLLKEQQEQLKRQQNELIQIQKTGLQLNTLGPFATGIAQQSTFAPSAASVLAKPTSQETRAFQNTPSTQTAATTGLFPNTFMQQQPTPGGIFAQRTAPQNLLSGQHTGPLNVSTSQSTGLATQSRPLTTFGQQTGSSNVQPVQTTGVNAQQAGTFTTFNTFGQATDPISQPQTSFNQNSDPFSKFLNQSQPNLQLGNQTTGPFALQDSMKPNQTGPFTNLAGPASVNPTSELTHANFPFQQQPNLLGNQNLNFQSSTPLQQPPAPSNSGNLFFNQLSSQRTGPFSQPQNFGSQATGPFQPLTQTTFGNQSYSSQMASPFGQQPVSKQITGPFPQPSTVTSFPTHFTGSTTAVPTMQTPNITNQRTGPFSLQPSLTTFGNQYVQPQSTGPFATVGQSQPSFSVSSAQTGQQQAPFGQQPVSQQFQTTFQRPGESQSQQGNLPQNTFQLSYLQQPGNQLQQPLQNQATGFGFGNQSQGGYTGGNYNIASATNPFGFK